MEKRVAGGAGIEIADTKRREDLLADYTAASTQSLHIIAASPNSRALAAD